MSKRKRRRREERRSSETSSNLGNSAPFGINPAQLMNLLGGNVDFNQIGNMLSSMKIDGLDLNNFNLNQVNNNQPNRTGVDFGPLQGMMNNLGLGNINMQGSNPSSFSFVDNDAHIDNIEKEDLNEEVNPENEENLLEEDFLEEDENIQMLIAIKSIVDSKKAIFIDKVIEAYNKGYFK
jgi:hypothetical protein